MSKEVTDPGKQERIIEEFLRRQRAEKEMPYATAMSVFKVAGVGLGLLLSLVLQVWAYFCLAFFFSDPTSDKNPAWLLIPLLPLLAVCWFVYRCYSTDEMEQTCILGCIVRLKALKRMITSEVCVAVTIGLLWCMCVVMMRPVVKQVERSNQPDKTTGSVSGHR